MSVMTENQEPGFDLDLRVRASMLEAFARARALNDGDASATGTEQVEERATRLVQSPVTLGGGAVVGSALVAHDTVGGVTVQLDAASAHHLTGGAAPGAVLPRLGLEKVPADGSVPGQPDPDQVWVSDGEANAHLHLAGPSGVLVVELGELTDPARIMLGVFGLGVVVCVGGNLLPGEDPAALARERSAGTVFGGLVPPGPGLGS
jgi:hypothetical protein